MAAMDALYKVIKDGKKYYIGGWGTDYDDLKFGILDSLIKKKGKVVGKDPILGFNMTHWCAILEEPNDIKDEDCNYAIDFDKKEVLVRTFFVKTIDDLKKDGYDVFEKEGQWYINYEPENIDDSCIEEIPFENRIDEKYLEKEIYTFDEFYQMKKDLENVIAEYSEKGTQYILVNGKFVYLDLNSVH